MKPIDVPRVNPNRARDHLANERTYLAWIRTAISLMGFGILIVRLRYTSLSASNGHGWKLGLVFALAGIIMTLGASQHYFAGLKAIENDTFEPSRHWIIVCSALVIIVGLGVLLYLFSSPIAPLGDDRQQPLF
jgi:putative membrane protein